MIDFIDVESSNLEKIGFDKDTKELFIKFKKSGIYKYKDVPEEVFEELKSASSKGGFLFKEIKGKYEYEKIEG